MADQGILAQLKPTAATNTVLYRAPVDQSASTVLNIANDGTASDYSVAVKNYDQRLTVDSANYLLHPGDVVSGYTVTVDQAMSSSSGFSAGQLITTEDLEKTFRFESFYVPTATEIFVKTVSLRQITLESVAGTFQVGETLSTGASPDDTTAVIYNVEMGTPTILYVGPSTINGSGLEFAEGDSVSSGNASGTISVGGIGTASSEFVFSNTTVGGTYGLYVNTTIGVYVDRTYRFDVSDSSMTGRDFKLSLTVNGEWGTDGIFGGASTDDGDEYTFGKTSNGTAGSAGAYVQYDFYAGYTTVDPNGTGGNYLTGSTLYFYDGGTGTPSNANYGGGNRYLQLFSSTAYTGFYVYSVDGTLVNNTDTFIVQGVTYTITSTSPGPYGYVRRYSGTTLDVIKGDGSVDFAATDTFRDNPILVTAGRSTVTVSSVDVASNAVTGENYIAIDVDNAVNTVDRITSLVVGPGEVVVVNSTTANNVFSLVGFEDASTAFPTRVFNYS